MFNHEYTKPVQITFDGIYIGVVEDNNDPQKMGRVKVRVLGLHTESRNSTSTDGVTTEQLPWATPANPIQGGSISGRGWSGVPEQGAHVLLMFVGGDHSFPIYFASIAGKYLTKPDFEHGFSDPMGKYPIEVNEPDFNKAGRGTVTDHGTPVGTEPANPAAPVYPKNTVLEVGNVDSGGKIVVEHDVTGGKERWSVTHVGAAGTSYMEIQPDGTIVHKAVGKRYDITVGNSFVHVGGALSENIVSNQTQTIGGTLDENITGAQTTDIGGTLQITVTGDATITAPNIELKKSGKTTYGVVTQECICAFTGKQHPDYSATVKASKTA